MKKILVPCDFSEPAIEAFRFAVDIAARSRESKITVLKVIDLPVFVYGASIDMPAYDFNPNLLADLEKGARQKFERMNKKFGKGFRNVSFSIAHGPVLNSIRETITEKKIDLVVMGTHGATGLAGFFVGSNTEKIVRFSGVPVFAVRKAVPLKSIKHIVFPTTLESHQTDFIKKLKVLQEFFNARLHLLFLNTPFNFIRDSDLNEYAKRHKFVNYTLNIRNDRYEPDGILSFVHEINADMLAMPTHGRKGLSHFLNGSVTENVVNQVKCPIWTYAIKKQI